MHAVPLTGIGGIEKLEYRDDVPLPNPVPGQVQVNVSAAATNNTDINTRTGWYDDRVETGPKASGGRQGLGVEQGGMGDWSGDIEFRRIQGADSVSRSTNPCSARL